MDMHTVDAGGIAGADEDSQDRLLSILMTVDERPCPQGCSCRGEFHTLPFGESQPYAETLRTIDEALDWGLSLEDALHLAGAEGWYQG